MMTLFQAATLSGWPAIMYASMSMTGFDKPGIHNNNPYMFLFFVAFVIVGAFFILNLFVGIVISTFNREKDKMTKDFLLSNI